MTLRPPQIVPVEGPIAFLNGPIQGARDWQQDVIDQFRVQAHGLTVACPRKDYEPGTFVYEAQVDWETHYRRAARDNGVNVFWLACEDVHDCSRPFAQTSRFEIGETLEWARQGAKAVIGIEPGFSNERYIRRRFSDYPSVPVVDDITMLVPLTLALLGAKRANALMA